jgi:hypothetical protein
MEVIAFDAMMDADHPAFADRRALRRTGRGDHDERRGQPARAAGGRTRGLFDARASPR